jgi:hypothetical protein
MSKPYDTRLIAVVAQYSFETNFNRFCKLVPLVYVDGERTGPEDFPNDGELWWMLSAQSAELATPGRLLSCMVEDARDGDEFDPTKSLFQATRDSVRNLEHSSAIEILTIPADGIANLQDLVSSNYSLTCLHQPSPTVLLRWRNDLYGPFIAQVDSPSPGSFRARFSPVHQEWEVYHIRDEDLRRIASGTHIATTTEVSPSQQRRSDCPTVKVVRHELVLASGFERILSNHPNKVNLEPIDQTLRRFARDCLSRQQKRQLTSLLGEMQIRGRDIEDAQKLTEAIQRVNTTLQQSDEALNTVTKALLESGLLGEDRIQKAQQEYADRYVEERKAELQAKAELALSSKREESRQLDSNLKNLRARLQKEEAEASKRQKIKLEEEAKVARQEFESERGRLDRDRAELQRQESLLKQNLQQVTTELRDAGDSVVNRFLAIAPLLQATVLQTPHATNQDSSQSVMAADKAPPDAFEIPAFITTEPVASELTDELAFFERFRRVVRENGFDYRLFDLQRFHVSVKCGDLTILGGPSGTGKSSLPMLYSKALLGRHGNDRRSGCLMVNVNPSWSDVRDLLGHVNTLDRRFYPAETGLFQHLIYAQLEHEKRLGSSRLYLACLDEMNLSQVEHYFSDFMMVLERQGEERAIQCFSPETIGGHCPFSGWPRIGLAPSLRFIGTVNFDETTRLLSDRLLDRANLIRLASGGLPDVAATDDGPTSPPEGSMITLGDFQAWQKDAALPADIASLLDSIRPLLNDMGSPLSPRCYRAICRFVASAQRIMPFDAAFDAQLAQRVIPKIRNLVTQRQLDALDRLLELLGASLLGSFEESRSLLTAIRDTAMLSGWTVGE